jgi:hypothetical protein
MTVRTKTVKVGGRQVTIVVEKRQRRPSVAIDENWLDFNEAAWKIEQRLRCSAGRADATLRGLCASGEVRAARTKWAVQIRSPSGIEMRKQVEAPLIRPSELRTTDVDFETDFKEVRIKVNEVDLDHWLGRQGELAKPEAKPKAKAKQGKVPRIIPLLQKMHPTGVPAPALCVRKELMDKLAKADPSLGSLDPKTLKSAIEQYNASIGNDRK